MRGASLNCRLALNGIQKASRLFVGTALPPRIGAVSFMARSSRFGGDHQRIGGAEFLTVWSK